MHVCALSFIVQQIVALGEIASPDYQADRTKKLPSITSLYRTLLYINVELRFDSKVGEKHGIRRRKSKLISTVVPEEELKGRSVNGFPTFVGAGNWSLRGPSGSECPKYLASGRNFTGELQPTARPCQTEALSARFALSSKRSRCHRAHKSRKLDSTSEDGSKNL